MAEQGELTQAEKDGLAHAINQATAGAEKNRGVYVFAHGVLVPIGAIATVIGLATGFLWAFWLVLPIGVVMALLGFLISAGVMVDAKQRTEAAAQAYMTELAQRRAQRPQDQVNRDS